MTDHRDERHRLSEPAWPAGDDPDATRWPRPDVPQERTGFWSPLWEDDNEVPAPRPARASGRAPANGHPNGHANGNSRPEPGRPVSPPGQQPTTAIRRPAAPALDGGKTVELPRDNSDAPTELLPPTPGLARREPDLLTHRDPDFDEDEDLLDDEDSPLSDDERRKRRKKIWRRVRRTMYVLLVLMIVGPVLAFFIAYQTVGVPSPRDIQAGQIQPVTLRYADGSELAKIVPEGANRTFVDYNDIPKQVLNAVFAAEDNTFMSNSGFDLSGVLRAGWNQLSGGTGGGSTITQQYVKKATGNEQKTISRKALEVVTAYKMNRTYSKEDIITAYLNTIYLGRNAYGIAAAAKAYYGKELKALTPSEAALLAGMIQGPGKFKDNAYMQRRWNYVMDQLVANNWFPADQRKVEQFPTPVPYEQTKTKALAGPRGQLQAAVYAEIADGPTGMNEDDLAHGGYIVQTTIDPKAQSLAESAVQETMKGQPENLQPGLVAVDPNNGEIKAYYGGRELGTDWARIRQEPGSSFKPFDLVALLETGKGLGEVFDGSSPRKFKGQERRNSENAQCPSCSVAEAMKRSVNTVFFDIALNVLNPQKVADAAKQAGITSKLSEPGSPPTDGIAIGGDSTEVSTIEMAASYATFASRGTYHAPHLVAKILNPDGSVYWQAPDQERAAFDSNPKTNAQIARNVTEALLPVPGYSKIPCADGRLCAGKTGTHQLGKTGKNAKAWMVGYTPQISTAVSLSAEKGAPIEDAKGGDIFGSRVPGAIWKRFMDNYHKTFKLPKEDFGKYEPIGKESPLSAAASSASSKPSNPGQQPNNPTTSTTQQPEDPPTTTTKRTRIPGPSGPTTIPGLPGPGDGTG
ncbi:MAG: transglycosylase domain-containing protein [Labedaea sp.]